METSPQEITRNFCSRTLWGLPQPRGPRATEYGGPYLRHCIHMCVCVCVRARARVCACVHVFVCAVVWFYLQIACLSRFPLNASKKEEGSFWVTNKIRPQWSGIYTYYTRGVGPWWYQLDGRAHEYDDGSRKHIRCQQGSSPSQNRPELKK